MAAAHNLRTRRQSSACRRVLVVAGVPFSTNASLPSTPWSGSVWMEGSIALDCGVRRLDALRSPRVHIVRCLLPARRLPNRRRLPRRAGPRRDLGGGVQPLDLREAIAPGGGLPRSLDRTRADECNLVRSVPVRRVEVGKRPSVTQRGERLEPVSRPPVVLPIPLGCCSFGIPPMLLRESLATVTAGGGRAGSSARVLALPLVHGLDLPSHLDRVRRSGSGPGAPGGPGCRPSVSAAGLPSQHDRTPQRLDGNR